MKTFRLALAGVLATATLATGTGGDAHAAGDPLIGVQVLDLLCSATGGTPYRTPMTIARCQEARSSSGFVLERLVCEGLLAATFNSAPSYGHPRRTTWVCIPNV